MEKLIYITFYSDPKTDDKRISAPSAVAKIDYIAEVMKSLGYEPEIYSLCEVRDPQERFVKYPGYVRNIGGTEVRFFDRYSSSSRLLRGLCLR